MEKLLTPKDVAALLQISKAKVYMLANQKKIPHIKIDRNIRFIESEIIRWIESRAHKC